MSNEWKWRFLEYGSEVGDSKYFYVIFRDAFQKNTEVQIIGHADIS